MLFNKAALFGIKRYSLGGDAGATRHRLNAGRSVAAGGEFVAGGLVNDLAGFIVAADLWATPAAPDFVGVDFVILLHDVCHSIDSQNVSHICST
jgi:hypothetical protein